MELRIPIGYKAFYCAGPHCYHHNTAHRRRDVSSLTQIPDSIPLIQEFCLDEDTPKVCQFHATVIQISDSCLRSRVAHTHLPGQQRNFV